MARPLLLDLFAGAGGAGAGYARAGFEVVGVDHVPQPRYPFRLVVADALDYLRDHGREYDVIHASPPCQRYSVCARMVSARDKSYPDLAGPVRDLLLSTGRPWPLSRFSLTLCGTMFGLRTRRHRLFESSHLLLAPANPCRHAVGDVGVRSGRVTLLGTCAKKYRVKAPRPGRSGLQGRPCEGTVAQGRLALGIDWMTLRELGQAVPPAYTCHLGLQLLRVVNGA